MIGSLFLLAAAALGGGAYDDAPWLSGPPAWRPRFRMPTKARRVDPDKKARRKARQAAQRRNRKS